MKESLLEVRARVELGLGKKGDAVCNGIREAGNKRPTKRVTREELGKVIQAAGATVPSSLLDEIWGRLKATDEGAMAKDVLIYFAPVKVAQYLNKLNKKAEATRLAQRNALECKRWDRAAQLEQHTLAVEREGDVLPLDADPLDTVHKAKERELMKNVRNATTSLLKQNAENALNLYRELMQIGHSPVATPRGSKYVIKDYERPRTADEFGGSSFNMIIDLLPPDAHQGWRGTLRKGLLPLWRDQHDAKKKQFEEAELKCMEQRKRGQHIAFLKSPYQSIIPRDPLPTKTAAGKLKAPGTPVMSRPHTSASRPGTGLGPPQPRPASRSGQPPPPSEARQLLRLLGAALEEQGKAASQLVGEIDGGAGGVVSRGLLEELVARSGVVREAIAVDALWRYLCVVYGTGNVTGESLDSAVEEAGEEGPDDFVTWVHPSRGMMLLGSRVALLLGEVQRKVKQRWKHQARETFGAIAKGGTIRRNELRGMLGALSMHVNPPDFEALWGLFTVGEVAPWSEVRAILELDEAEASLQQRDEAQAARAAQMRAGEGYGRVTTSKNKLGAGLKPDPWDSMSEAEKIQTLMTTTNARAYGGSTDPYAMHAPLYWKAGQVGVSPQRNMANRMRPLSQGGGSRPASVDVGKHSVKWADSRPSKRRSQTPDPLGSLPEGDPGPMLNPFSAMGSDLKMSWRRWNGGSTLGAQKSNAQDPAAPGLTASLMPGAGEFKKEFDAKTQQGRDLTKLLEENPDIEWNPMKSSFRLPPGFLDREAAAGSVAFPTGMQAGNSRPSSRAALSGAETRRSDAGGEHKPKLVLNSQGVLKKEQSDSGEARLIGKGTYWRDVGPPWNATSKDIGGKLPPPAPTVVSEHIAGFDATRWATHGLGYNDFG